MIGCRPADKWQLAETGRVGSRARMRPSGGRPLALTGANPLAHTVTYPEAHHLEIRCADTGVPADDTFASVMAALPALRSVALVPNRADVAATIAAATAVRRHCRQRRVAISADFTLDADADAVAALGGAPTSLIQVLEASRALADKRLPVRWWIPLLAPLTFRLEALVSLARDEQADVRLVPPHMAPQPPAAPMLPLDPDHRRFVRDFIAWRLLGEDRPRVAAPAAAFYQTLHDALDESAERPHPWPDETVAVLAADAAGEWTLTTHRRPSTAPLRGEAPDDGAPSSTRSPRVGHLADVAGVFAEGLRAVAQWTATALSGRAGRPRSLGPVSLPRVLVIGAYGGDHIGDTAIVGGVLCRIHKRYQTRSAILVSQRPAHTGRLVAMLDLPVRIRVEEYDQRTVGALLSEVDAVVFGGGPLMDLPKQLVKHLYTVSRARRAGKPFIIEGIGAGPFIRRVSAWTARLFVRMAERVTVRTAVDAGAPLVRGLDPIAGRDPAFDYLDTRGAVLTRLPADDRQWIDRLLHDTAGRPTIAINLRPLRPEYTEGSPAGQQAEHTRRIEAQFEERLAEAMRRFHAAAVPPPCFIFFPMNAIQFGSSDLRSAYRVRRLLGAGVDFRIWEADPAIDGVVALLRRVDIAITMRFHATIYALSQGTRVIGIDYRPGKSDKVAALLTDAGSAHNCSRIDLVTTEWLAERLDALRLPRTAESMPPPVRRPVPT